VHRKDSLFYLAVQNEPEKPRLWGALVSVQSADWYGALMARRSYDRPSMLTPLFGLYRSSITCLTAARDSTNSVACLQFAHLGPVWARP